VSGAGEGGRSISVERSLGYGPTKPGSSGRNTHT